MKRYCMKIVCGIFSIIAALAVIATAEPDPNFHCYLLFGQSNMAGGCKEPNEGDCDTTDRVKVLAYTDCQGQSGVCTQFTLNRQRDEWYTAFPPFHDCDEGIGIADNFAKHMLDSIHQDITIGLIPCALSGMSMQVFRKSAVWGEMYENEPLEIPDWCQKDLFSAKRLAYLWMLERCMIAQQSGVIKGILIHQGETDNTKDWWVDTTGKILDDLKSDLSLPDTIPVLVGELLQDVGACCADHNQRVHELAESYDHCEYVSSEGLKMRPGDQYSAHFDCPGFKEFGIRYADKLLEMADSSYIPRRTTAVIPGMNRGAKTAGIQWNQPLTVYSLDGRVVATVHNSSDLAKVQQMVSGKLYIAAQGTAPFTTGIVMPFVKK